MVGPTLLSAKRMGDKSVTPTSYFHHRLMRSEP